MNEKISLSLDKRRWQPSSLFGQDDLYAYLRMMVFLEGSTYGVAERAHRLPGAGQTKI